MNMNKTQLRNLVPIHIIKIQAEMRQSKSKSCIVVQIKLNNKNKNCLRSPELSLTSHVESDIKQSILIKDLTVQIIL